LGPNPGFKVLSYAAKYKNIQIEGGLAWGGANMNPNFANMATRIPGKPMFRNGSGITT
jgi:hypothetical protein